MKTEERNIGHLTTGEISQWLVEGPDQSAVQHVKNCSACEAKLAEAKAPLTVFRGALVAWSDAQPTPHLQTALARNEAPSDSRLWLPAVICALAVLLIFAYAKVPALLHGNSKNQAAIATASATPDSDEALLNQVDTEVSEAVPDAMAPLTDLVSWDSSEEASSKARATEKRATGKTSTKLANATAQHDVTD